MVAVTYTSDLTDIYMFESVTGVSAWNITGSGGASLGASPDYAVEGTNSVDKQISASEKGFMYDNTTPWTIGPNDHHFVWITVAVYGLTATRDNRGICVCIGNGVSDYIQFHMNGSDTLPFGGVLPYAVRFDNTALTNFRTLTGTPDTAPDFIGATASVTGTAKFSNLGVDAARIGTGYDILNGTGADSEGDFAGIVADDVSTAEGILLAAAGGYKLQGKLRIGNSGTECEFLDLNTNIFLVNSLSGQVLSDFTEIIVSDDLSIMTLTNVNIIALGAVNPGRFEMVTPLITAQDETSYDNSPTTEGTFAVGTGYSVADVITLDDGWTLVTVDTLSGSAVATFTVDSTKGRTAVAGTTMAQLSVAPTGGTGFTLTPDTDNILGDGTATFENVGFIDFGETVLTAGGTLNNGRWIGCDQITANGSDLTGSAVSGYEGTADTSAMIWNVATDPTGKLEDITVTMGTALTHAIEFGLNSPTSMTISGWTISGYHADNAQSDSTFHFLRTTGSVTLNVSGMSGPLSYKTAGATINIVASVAVNVHVKDEALVDIANAQVSVHRATVVAETSGAGNTVADVDLVITGTIPADQPGAGYITVLDRSLEAVQGYRYASHDGTSTFAFPTIITGSTTSETPNGIDLISTSTNFLTADIEEGDTVRNTTTGDWAIVDEITDANNIVTTPLQGAGDNLWNTSDGFSFHTLATTLVSGVDIVDMPLSNGQTDTNGDAPTLSYDSTQAPTAVTIRVRYNDGATKYIPFKTSGTISATTGLTLDVTMAEDTVAT